MDSADLDSSFPQTENPCLIVEDSQPDSVALEDDPETSYCALLARRLSNLQDTSHSPVLELISSPSKSLLPTDNQTEKSGHTPHSGLEATEESQVFEVCSRTLTKRSDTQLMEPEANSTEAQDEMSQFGFLELSESQGFNKEEDEHEEESQKAANHCGLKTSDRTSPEQDGSSKGSKISSLCPLKAQDGESAALSVQAILHSQASDSQDQIISSQDDMFEKEKNAAEKAVGNVSETEIKHLPTSTPSHSLHLLHLSGQDTLVQESLSQRSVDFVAATQEHQAPYIVPNSPTEKEQNYDAAESPMDTSAPLEDQPQAREEEPMDMDLSIKPSTEPITRNPKVDLEKRLSVPSQPEFSHDVFLSTPSLETENNIPGSLKRTLSQQNSPSRATSDAPRPSVPAEKPSSADSLQGFQLELSSENNISVQQTQPFTVEEDSQATQIEEDESSSPKHYQQSSRIGLESVPNSQNVSKMLDPTSKDQIGNSGNIEVQITGGASSDSVPDKSSQRSSGCAKKDEVSCVPADVSSQSSSVLIVSSQPTNDKSPTAAKLSQPVLHSHVITDSIRNTEEDRMEEGETLSVMRSAGLDLNLSPSQALSPEPMEEEDKTKGQSSSKEDLLTVMVLDESQRVSQEKANERRSQSFKSSSQPTRSVLQEEPKSVRKATCSQPLKSPLQNQRSKAQSTKPSDPEKQKHSADVGVDKSLSDSSSELPFHFTLPKEGEMIRPAVSATPPQIAQLKKTPRHSTPIEAASFSEPSEVDVSRDPDSEILVEESTDGEEPGLTKQNGKQSVRMNLETPGGENSSASEHFSLQKPSLTDDEGSVSKTTAVASSSVFSRVREANRQGQMEEEVLSKDSPIRQQSRPFNSLLHTNESKRSSNHSREMADNTTPVTESVPHRSTRPTGSGMNSEQPSRGVSSTGREQEVVSASEKPRTPIRQRAVSQQTSIDVDPTSPPAKRAVSQQTSFDLSGPHNLSQRGDQTTPTKTHPGPSVRRHIRTIQEVRTTVTRIITDVYYEDGTEINRKVTHEAEEPVVDRCVVDDVSPSRTGSSMTSGDLADISSLSSRAASHHSSSGTSSIRMPDFLMPPSRGAKSGRSGVRQQPRTHSDVVGSEVTGRGRVRRGRPPSRISLSRGGRAGQKADFHGQTSSSEEDALVQKPNPAPGSPLDASATSFSDSLRTTSPDGSTGASSFVGLRVLAKWSSNSYFYSGTITRDLGENRFGLLFDDNQECEVPGKDVLLCDPIPLETEVTALTKEEYFSIGVVKGHKTQDSEFLYCVERDGESRWYSRTAVILSLDQGQRLREQYGLGPYEPSVPQTMASDISLDNLVEGKRRRRANASDVATPVRSSKNSPRTPGKHKLISSTEERTPPKRGRRGGGARMGQRLAGCNTSGSGVDLPQDPNHLVLTHGPLPENPSLFMGFVFMLTVSSENDRDSSSTATDEDDDVQRAPYNRQYTVKQLEAGGGIVLPDFNEEQCKAAYQSLLIADQHCRTRKYLLCVAGGVPCVSQMWLRDCCQEKKLLNYRNYLLPAGLGPEGRIVEWHPRCEPFKLLKVLVVLEERVNLWTTLLSMGGAAQVHHHKENDDISALPTIKFDVAIAASPHPRELRQVGGDLPIVSLEWLIQSVISGKCLGYDRNSEFCQSPSK